MGSSMLWKYTKWLFQQLWHPTEIPAPQGPYQVSVDDIMLGYGPESLFMRIYYPTQEHQRWRRLRPPYETVDAWDESIPWVPDSSYLEGIIKVLGLIPWIARFILWWYSVGTVKVTSVIQGGSLKIGLPPLKCIIFSHGLGGSRFICSAVCCELASRGFLVLAPEHRDGSACYTYYYASADHARCDRRTAIPYQNYPPGCKDHSGIRHKQVVQRADECMRLCNWLRQMQKVDPAETEKPFNVLEDADKWRKLSAVDSGQLRRVSLNTLVGKIDADNICLMGHSFGAATALQAASLPATRSKYVVLLDPWMFPIKNEKHYETIQQPMLFVNTQTFHIAVNVSGMQPYMEKAEDQQRQMFTILKTTHEHQSDSALLVGSWMNWCVTKLDPLVALRINNAVILRFLQQHVMPDCDISDCTRLLQEHSEYVVAGLTKPWS